MGEGAQFLAQWAALCHQVIVNKKKTGLAQGLLIPTQFHPAWLSVVRTLVDLSADARGASFKSVEVTKMSVRIRPILMLASALAGLAAGFAHATDATTCSTEIGQVKQAIEAATFFEPKAYSNKTNLLAKVDSATAKLGQNKPADAIDNLMSVSDKATDLATAPKPKLDDASAINTAVAGAIACIGAAN